MTAPLAAIRALVFDLDGTLADSLDDIALHLNDALEERGLPKRTRAEISDGVGHGAEYLVAHTVASPDLVPAVLAAFRAHYRARPVIETHLYAGIDAMLDALAPGRALAVLSNKPHDLTVTIAGALLARWPFPVVAGQQSGRPRKPDPAAAVAVLAELGCTPGDAALIGDSEVDVQTARAAGMHAIAVAWGLRPLSVLRDAGPEHVVHSPAELTALFG